MNLTSSFAGWTLWSTASGSEKKSSTYTNGLQFFGNISVWVYRSSIALLSGAQWTNRWFTNIIILPAADVADRDVYEEEDTVVWNEGNEAYPLIETFNGYVILSAKGTNSLARVLPNTDLIGCIHSSYYWVGSLIPLSPLVSLLYI